MTRSQAAVWIAACRNKRSGNAGEIGTGCRIGNSTSGTSSGAGSWQAQVENVVTPGSKGPSGPVERVLLAQDNGQRDRSWWNEQGWAGIFTETGGSGSQRVSVPAVNCACVRVVRVVWAVRAGIER